MKRFAKLITAFFIFMAFCYSGLWFYSANQLKNAIAQQALESGDKFIKFDYEKLETTGFPLRMEVKFSNLNIEYPQLMRLKLDTVEVVSNLLFNNLKISIPGKVYSETMTGTNKFEYDTIYKKPFKLNCITESKFNTVEVIKAIFKDQFPLDIKLKELNLSQEDSEVFMANSQNKVSQSSLDLKILFQRANSDITNINIIGAMNSEIYDSFALGAPGIYFPFKKLDNKIDISLKHKGDGELGNLPYVNIKDFQIALDEFRIIISVLAENTQDDTKLEAKISIYELNNLLDLLVKDQQITEARKQVLLSIFKDITGEENLSNPLAFEVKKEKDEFIIGKQTLLSLFKYSKDFMLSK